MNAYEAWWMPAHVEFRFVGCKASGERAFFSSLAAAQAWARA